MLKGREIRGLPVFAGPNREEAGRVRDLVISEQSGSLEALVVASGGLWQKSLLLKTADIASISALGVFISGKERLQNLPKETPTLSQKGWVGRKLFSEGGLDKGTVADILLEENMVTGLEISNGLVGDLQAGRNFLSWQSVHLRQESFVEENSPFSRDLS
ncbi:MAG: PRC-barrel domain-containing protein [Clostridiales bacterium]|nr:PRC-barrel domain-containing protein [Clostridiales bacterium]